MGVASLVEPPPPLLHVRHAHALLWAEIVHSSVLKSHMHWPPGLEPPGVGRERQTLRRPQDVHSTATLRRVSCRAPCGGRTGPHLPEAAGGLFLAANGFWLFLFGWCFFFEVRDWVAGEERMDILLFHIPSHLLYTLFLCIVKPIGNYPSHGIIQFGPHSHRVKSTYSEWIIFQGV